MGRIASITTWPDPPAVSPPIPISRFPVGQVAVTLFAAESTRSSRVTLCMPVNGATHNACAVGRQSPAKPFSSSRKIDTTLLRSAAGRAASSRTSPNAPCVLDAAAPATCLPAGQTAVADFKATESNAPATVRDSNPATAPKAPPANTSNDTTAPTTTDTTRRINPT